MISIITIIIMCDGERYYCLDDDHDGGDEDAEGGDVEDDDGMDDLM